MLRRLHVGLFAVASLATSVPAARAGDNDVVMSRLGVPIENGAGQVTRVVGDNRRFRSLMSELGVVMAPHLIEPADTLGFAGFQFTLDLAYTSISSGESYWDVLEGENDGFMNTVGVFARKGIWLPLPSFEVGVGAVKLAGSELWSAQGYAKFALHEGYHDLPIPSLSARGAVSRVMGSDQLDLTIGSFDLVVSKHFGVGGVFNLTPFAGWNALFIVPRSEVIDRTPNIDAFNMPEDSPNNFVFRDQDTILRNRFLGGVKFKYNVFTVSLEVNIALAGTSTDDRPGTDMTCADTPTTDDCDSTDQAAGQQTYTVALGLDF